MPIGFYPLYFSPTILLKTHFLRNPFKKITQRHLCTFRTIMVYVQIFLFFFCFCHCANFYLQIHLQ